jgi:peptidyl-prolyl cis-trans isomerase C
MKHPTLKPLYALLALACLVGLNACKATPATSTPTSTKSAAPTSMPTLTPTITNTPVPMAFLVNGEGIPVEEFKAEVKRYQAAQEGLGATVTQEQAEQAVRDDLIDQLLLAQGAAANGYSIDEAGLQKRINDLAAQIGGAEALAAWQTEHGYSEASFREALRRQVNAAWMRDQISAAVPSTGEQVHAWQILLYNDVAAQAVLDRLNNGETFADLAREYDPVTRGELGWFPRGYLLDQAIEEAVFALQPGQHSGIVQSAVGFHLLYVVERDPNRPVSSDALLTLQNHALEAWLQQQRDQSTIIVTP